MSYLSDYANNVSQILLARGDAQARARLQSGQAWQQAFGQIGQTLGNLPGQMQQQRTKQMEDEARRLQLDAAKRSAADVDILDKAYASYGGDIDTLLNSVPGHLRGTVQKTLSDYEKAKADAAETRAKVQQLADQHKAAQNDALGALAAGVKAMGNTPEAAIVALSHMVNDGSGLISKQDAQQYLQHLTRPEDVAKLTDALIAQSPKYAALMKKPEGFTLSEGQQRFTPDGQVIAEVAPKTEKLTYGAPVPAMVDGKKVFVRTGSDGRTYDLSGKVITSNPSPIEPAAPKDNRIVQVMGPNGVPIWMNESEAIGKPAAQAPRAVTGAERQALSFYNRAKDAVTTITPLEEQVAKMGLGGQAQLQYAPNFMQSELGQQYRQAQRAFTEARLRKESGAAIPNTEFENDAKTYFVQPGDTPDTIRQKAAARAKVLDGLGYSAGKAYEEYYGEPMPRIGGGNAPQSGSVLAPPAGWVIK